MFRKITAANIIICVLGICCGSVFGADGPEFEITADYFGKYIWRGQTLATILFFNPVSV